MLPPSAKADVLGEVRKRSDASRSLTFATTSIDDLNAVSPAPSPSQGADVGDNDNMVVLEDVFLSASESGCIVSRAEEGKGEKPWKSVVPGGLTSLRWSA